MKLFIDIVMKRIYLFNIVAWNYRKKIGFPVCRKENFAGLLAHRKRGKSARASPSHIKWRAERSFHRPTFIRPAFTLLRHFRHHLLRWTASGKQTEVLSRSRKFRSTTMNLNSFLCRFPTVFRKYIRILDQVSQIREFHWISFEFQRFQYRPKICFLDIYHRLYNNINDVRNIKLFVTIKYPASWKKGKESGCWTREVN